MAIKTSFSKLQKRFVDHNWIINGSREPTPGVARIHGTPGYPIGVSVGLTYLRQDLPRNLAVGRVRNRSLSTRKNEHGAGPITSKSAHWRSYASYRGLVEDDAARSEFQFAFIWTKPLL